MPLSGEPVTGYESVAGKSLVFVKGFGFLFSFCFLISLKLLRRMTLALVLVGDTESARDRCCRRNTMGDGQVVVDKTSLVGVFGSVSAVLSDCWCRSGMFDIELAFSSFLLDFLPCALARRFFQKEFLDFGLSQSVVEIFNTPVSGSSFVVEILRTLLLLLAMLSLLHSLLVSRASLASLELTIMLCLLELALLQMGLIIGEEVVR